jgi:hypothetical protein
MYYGNRLPGWKGRSVGIDADSIVSALSPRSSARETTSHVLLAALEWASSDVDHDGPCSGEVEGGSGGR